MYNTCCFSTATIGTRTRLIVMLYVHCLSCLLNNSWATLRDACFTENMVCFRYEDQSVNSVEGSDGYGENNTEWYSDDQNED